jgi:redox-sensitive bicupin YhaK (pirin superfamily)
MPEQEAGVMEGFQLWLNLPARDKLCEPWYRDIQSAEIPEVTTSDSSPDGRGGVTIRVIAGQSHGVAGALQRDAAAYPTDALYLDLHFPASGAVLHQPLPLGHNAFVYVYRGTLQVIGADDQETSVPRQRMAILTNTGGAVQLRSDGNGEPARALLIAGKPLGEPIAQYGPFVMNTREELMTAVEDFQNGRMG